MKYCSRIIVISTEPDPDYGEVYAEGWYACKNGLSIEDNPYLDYKPGTSYDIYRMDWNSGYRDCEKELNTLNTNNEEDE